MGDTAIILKPGLNTDATPLLAGEVGIWSESNLIRFQGGLPQKVDGWNKFCPSPVVGQARKMHIWADLVARKWIAVGTNERLQIVYGGVIYDITPVRATHNVAVDFSTVDTTVEVTIVDVGHGGAVGDWVNIVTAVSVGGIVLQGFYKITSVIDADTYTVDAASAATATVNNGGAVALYDTTNADTHVDTTLADHGYIVGQVYTNHVSTTVGGITINGTYSITAVADADHFTFNTSTSAGSTTSGSENGGNVRLQYILASGLAYATPASGWGVGDFGAGDWGLSNNSGATITPPRMWFLDNYGQDLIANYTGGPLYSWSPAAVTTPAALVSGAPTQITAAYVANPAQQVMAFGVETGGVFDPMLIRWSEAGDITDWVASVTNQAGSFRLSNGSKIVDAMMSPLQVLVWTDDALWSGQYQGLPYVWVFTLVSVGCGLVSDNAMGQIGDRTIWLSNKGFFELAGRGAKLLSCPIWDKIFADINMEQVEIVHCAEDNRYSLMTWYYPSKNSDEIDSFVTYKSDENLWWFGRLPRLTWSSSNLFGDPIGIDASGFLMQHGAIDADGAMMGEFIRSGYFDLGEGEDFIFVERLLPDINWAGSTASTPSVQITVYMREYEGDTPTVFGPYTVTPTSKVCIVRGRNREAAIEIGASGIGAAWRLGKIRHNGRPDGRR